jgi:hypothetical protein
MTINLPLKLSHFPNNLPLDGAVRIELVERINNKLKLIKRLGYGFRNFSNFRLRSLLNWHSSINSP